MLDKILILHKDIQVGEILSVVVRKTIVILSMTKCNLVKQLQLA